THVAYVGLGDGKYEGPVVAPATFGPYGGQILVPHAEHDAVHAIDNLGNVTQYVFPLIGAEGVLVIPSTPCSFGNSDTIFVSALQPQSKVVKLSTSDFTGLGGDILITSEQGYGILREHWNGTGYDQSVFDTTSLPYEGSA